MINKIIDAIALSLNAEFTDTHEIYTESIQQGLKEPCFFIFCLNPTSDLFLNKRYFRRNQFCIQYFPLGSDVNAECNAVLERLFNCLGAVTVDNSLVNGTKMHGEIVDGVLNFFVNYDLFVYKVTNDDNQMNTYGASTKVKG
ncbi:MAG: hypothetical protein RR012_01185 [Oscillospiraceae bacterium]